MSIYNLNDRKNFLISAFNKGDKISISSYFDLLKNTSDHDIKLNNVLNNDLKFMTELFAGQHRYQLGGRSGAHFASNNTTKPLISKNTSSKNTSSKNTSLNSLIDSIKTHRENLKKEPTNIQIIVNTFFSSNSNTRTRGVALLDKLKSTSPGDATKVSKYVSDEQMYRDKQTNIQNKLNKIKNMQKNFIKKRKQNK